MGKKLVTVLLTGASGFVGRAVFVAASTRQIKMRACLRNKGSTDLCDDADDCAVLVPNLQADTDWKAALEGVDAVVHCAARVHLMHENSSDPLPEFREINVGGTLNLARQAAMAGVRRFVFISSIKVNGEETQNGRMYTAEAPPAPKDAYGISKAEAELGLRQLAGETGMEVTIIRPPLVYGPGAKGNFSGLLRWVIRGLPLPLGAAVTNRRSFVALDNLVDLVLTCIDHPNAANQIFLVSDGDDLSTASFLRLIGDALNRPVYLLPVPVSILNIVATFLGKSEIAQRLLGSLQLDISKTCALLDWKPPISVEEGLRRAVQGLNK